MDHLSYLFTAGTHRQEPSLPKAHDNMVKCLVKLLERDKGSKVGAVIIGQPGTGASIV